MLVENHGWSQKWSSIALPLSLGLVEARFLNQIQSSPICSDLKFPIPPSKAGIPGRLPVLTQYLHRFWGYELLPVGFHDKQLVTEPALQSFPLISCPKLDSHRLLLTLASLKQNLPYNQIYKFKRTLKCCLFFLTSYQLNTLLLMRSNVDNVVNWCFLLIPPAWKHFMQNREYPVSRPPSTPCLPRQAFYHWATHLPISVFIIGEYLENNPSDVFFGRLKG